MTELRRSSRLAKLYTPVKKPAPPTPPPSLSLPPVATPPRLLQHYIAMIQRLKDPRAIADIVIKLFEYVLDNYDRIEQYCKTDEMKDTILSLQEMMVETPDISLCKKIEAVSLVESISRLTD